MFDFTEPSAQNPVSAVCSRKAFVSPETSIGSPNDVPVPCASTYPIDRGSIAAAVSASPMTSDWATGLGTE